LTLDVADNCFNFRHPGRIGGLKSAIVWNWSLFRNRFLRKCSAIETEEDGAHTCKHNM
jgi:hypothetical protein